MPNASIIYRVPHGQDSVKTGKTIRSRLNKLKRKLRKSREDRVRVPVFSDNYSLTQLPSGESQIDLPYSWVAE